MTTTTAAAATPSHSPPTTAISIRGLTKIHRGAHAAPVVAVDDVDLDVPAGAFTAVMGPSGSGKSSLLQCAAGLDRPTSGSVEVAATRIDRLCDADLAKLRRRAIGFVFQSYNLLPTLTVAQNITLPRVLDRRRTAASALETILEAVDLVERRDHLPAQLSGGQQQRVAIARALIGEPAVVFADEPTGALDSVGARDVLVLLRRTVSEFGRTVVMVTHDPVAAAAADDVVFMANGKVVDRAEGGDPARIAAWTTRLAQGEVRTAC